MTEAAPPASTRRRAIGVVACCVFPALVLLGLVVYPQYLNLAPPAVRAKHFLCYAGAGDTASAHRYLFSPLTTTKTEAAFAAEVAANPELWQLEDPTLGEPVFVKGVATVTGTARSKKTGATIHCRFQLRAESGTWGIVKYELQKAPFSD